MMKACMIYIGLVICFVSCNNKDEIPSGILKPNQMQAVLWDVIKADAFTTEFIKRDSSKNALDENLKLQQQIFAIHKTSKEIFYKSYDYYKANAARFKNILDSMIAQNERNKNKPKGKIKPFGAD